ncbi:unnamed protein product [Oikopleura dioica]|uniref:Uncharacterized protein n=1 Tax=Oikopleura dioica TaxID=34765 RepID=E4WT83_OIKDI|nr:unnamed protein product [Oikopleura dioica]
MSSSSSNRSSTSSARLSGLTLKTAKVKLVLAAARRSIFVLLELTSGVFGILMRRFPEQKTSLSVADSAKYRNPLKRSCAWLESSVLTMMPKGLAWNSFVGDDSMTGNASLMKTSSPESVMFKPSSTGLSSNGSSRSSPSQ